MELRTISLQTFRSRRSLDIMLDHLDLVLEAGHKTTVSLQAFCCRV